jgi:DNA-binding transcriptional LysR family regulator
LDFHHLRNMLAVLELGSLGKAAEKLHISQPALTKSIQRLEEQLGVRLFERGARGMTGTVYAETLRPYAQSVSFGMAQAVSEINALKRGIEGMLTVAGPSVVTGELFPETVVRLSAQRPKLQIRVVAQDQMLCSSLISGEFGLVVAPFYNGSPKPGLIRNWLFDDELVVITRPKHPLTRLRKVQPSHLQACSWLFAEHDSVQRFRLTRYFEEAGLAPPKITIESSTPAMQKGIIARSDHVGLISKMGVQSELNSRTLRAIEIDSRWMKRPIGFLYREDEPLSPAMRAFTDILRSVCQERGYFRGEQTESPLN